MKKIQVILADDHRIVRKGCRALLNEENDIQVVGEATDGREALQLVDKLHPDVLVTDLQMPGMQGLEAIRRLKQSGSPVGVLVLTMHKDTESILRALRGGAAGYVLKDAAVSDLVQGIRTVYQGEIFLSPSIATQVITRLMEGLGDEDITSPLELLTDREREILQLLAEGRSRQEISDLLSVSPKTVDSHRANLMNKLDLNNEAALVRFAARYGLISLEM
ncbi:MAG: response regulator transcription factor [Anaerolineales bacterium]|nr:response regulator transcription factor [Anaerolineales bacterium]